MNVPSTLAALGVVALALLPGALYTWGFERIVGAWGIRLVDRIPRFMGISAIGHAFLAPVTLYLWVTYVKTGRVGNADIPLYIWPLVLAYVLGPLVLGTLIGRATLNGSHWARWFTGSDPAPRAWDYLFGLRPKGWVRLRLKSGAWIGGAYGQRSDGRKSYASGYPEPQELFLVDTAEMDPDTGQFRKDHASRVRMRGSSMLIRWSEIEYLEFIDG